MRRGEWKSKPNAKAETKRLEGAFEIKDEATGEFEAIIATLNVVDRDGDVILPGAFQEGQQVAVSDYGHSAVFGVKPVGKGKIHVEGNKAKVRGNLFMDLAGARETLVVLKEMGSAQQWSFGYEVIGAEKPSDEWRKKGAWRIITKLDSFETSPVLRGAGIGTRTTSAKCDACAAKEQADGAGERCSCAGQKGEAPPPPPAPVEPTAEEKAAAEAEAKRLADDAAARAAAEQAEAERKAAEFKARAREAVEEFHRVQRTLKRLRLVS